MRRREYIYFKPTGEHFLSKKDFDEAHEAFYTGELSEDFAHFCAQEAIHAFWFNYKVKDNKISKEKFCQKFKELVNQMLKEI